MYNFLDENENDNYEDFSLVDLIYDEPEHVIMPYLAQPEEYTQIAVIEDRVLHYNFHADFLLKILSYLPLITPSNFAVNEE
jgi:hypothetical protein